MGDIEIMEEKRLLLYAKGIEKQFAGVPVLKSVDLGIGYGEVNALMGENGAGKSTLIKIITGIYKMDGGQIYLEGEPVDIHNRQDARQHGIAVIYQELSLQPALTVLENVFLGQEITKFNFLSRKQMHAKVQALIDKYSFPVKPNDFVESLGMAKRQIVEILKALSMDAKLIIMDEPTSSLAKAEVETLFKSVESLRAEGKSILYISHRFEEISRLADRLTVLRDGENAGNLEKEDISIETVTRLMIGYELEMAVKGRSKAKDEENCLEVKGLKYKSLLKNISFKAYGGEILGIGGLVGSGRTEIIKCIFGAAKPSAGTITLNGQTVSGSINSNIRNGFGLVPEDRHGEGIVPILSVCRNVVMANYDTIAPRWFVNKRREVSVAEQAIVDYDIRPANRQLPVMNMSGGNQQKVVVGRWLTRHLNVLLLDEPTVGIDVGVKAELYRMIEDLSASGVIVIMVSSDLEELTSVSDRILIIHDGRVFEEFIHGNVTQNAILLASSGLHTKEGRAV